MLLTPKLLKRLNERAREAGLRGLLQDLSRELRSEDVPATLRSAAATVADLLDGRGTPGEAAGGAVIINLSVAVAVGAPGKPEGESSGAPEGGTKEALVIASAIATSPGAPRQAQNTPDLGAAESA